MQIGMKGVCNAEHTFEVAKYSRVEFLCVMTSRDENGSDMKIMSEY